MNDLIQGENTASERALATAQWAKPDDVTNLAYKPGSLWMGRAADAAETAIGFNDDRHALIVAGSRSGKGTSSIIPNLCLYPGSIVVIDPKGENATITAARRESGSEYCEGLEQRTFVFDPFKTAQVADELRASFNPLDALDPDNEESVDDASRIADALVVSENAKDPYWDDQARLLIKGLILHVITSDDFEGQRNLVTIRKFIMSGETDLHKLLEEQGEENIPTAFQLLFEGMKRNTAFHGIVSGIGDTFASLAISSDKTLSGILSSAGNHTEFIDSPPMRRILSKTSPGFKLSALKTDPMGISVYLSLPQRFMNTHFRWLRMMVSLTITEMEKTAGKPQSGHPVLLLLDEFAGLKKMEIIENAAAQIAGFGVKMCFIVQQLTQLKTIYKDNWEIFIGNSGTKLFFGIEDKFTREFLSKYLGDTEVTRTTRNQSQTFGTSSSTTHGTSTSSSSSRSSSSGGSSGTTTSFGSGTSSDVGFFWDTKRTNSTNSSFSSSSSKNWSSSTSYSTSSSSNQSETHGKNESKTAGTGEAIHKRPLLTPDEIGLVFSRIEEKDNPAYPGLALAIAIGKKPMIVRRTNYYDDHAFEGKFVPHPDHEFKKLEAKKQKIEVLPKKHVGDELIEKYGIENYKKACSIYRTIQQDYPHIEILKYGEVEFARGVLTAAQKSIDIAAADGRPHTMNETLNIAQQILGNFFIQNPDFKTIENIEITYGDEDNGKAARKRKLTLILSSITAFIIFILWMINVHPDILGNIIVGVVILAFLGWIFD